MQEHEIKHELVYTEKNKSFFEENHVVFWSKLQENDKYKVESKFNYDEINKDGFQFKREVKNDDPKDYEVYNFKDSGDGESWMIGDESTNKANAFIEGYSQCPENITVPRSLTNEEGETRSVEVIGQRAYYYCGHLNWGKETKTVLVTKQVKIIKSYGFGSMYNVESFRIEDGSILESIESNGLQSIGFNTGRDDESKRGTLILPSTLSSVASNGISACNLFKIIIYCGTNSLTNTCQLEYSTADTEVMVIDQYLADTIFGRTPLYDSPTEVEGNCSTMELKIAPSPIISNTFTHYLFKTATPILLSFLFALIHSHSLSSSSSSSNPISASYYSIPLSLSLPRLMFNLP